MGRISRVPPSKLFKKVTPRQKEKKKRKFELFKKNREP